MLSAQELSPLWMFPADPVLQQTAKGVFARPESPLSPVLNSGMIDSPLLALPVYRQAVLSALVDTKVVGTATRSPEGLVSYRATNRADGAPAEPGRDVRVPPGHGRPVRVKDLVASALSRLDGAPEFDLYWPEAHKRCDHQGTHRISKRISEKAASLPFAARLELSKQRVFEAVIGKVSTHMSLPDAALNAAFISG